MRDKDKVEVFCKKCGRPFLIPRDVWELAMLAPPGAVPAFFCCTVVAPGFAWLHPEKEEV
jgi:hypothetical protein